MREALNVVFKIVLLGGLLLILRVYQRQFRTRIRDRFVMLLLFAGLAASVIDPEITQWVAERFGITRGADFVFYLAHLTMFFVVGVLYARYRSVEQAMTRTIRELALVQAREAPERTE